MSKPFKEQFFSNLLTTFKFVGIVFFGVSIKIVFDSIRDDNSEDLLFPLYFLAFIPIIFVGVYSYTKLKQSSINKFVSCLCFGAIMLVATVIFYLAGNYFDNSEINLRSIKVIGLLTFSVTALLYLQLPWKKDE